MQFQTLWKLVNGLMSCALNLEMLIGKPVTGKRSEAAKDSNPSTHRCYGKKNTRAFFMMFFPCVDSKPGQYSILDVLVDEYPFIHRCPVWVGTSVGFRNQLFRLEPDESGNNSGWIYVIMTCPCHRITLTISQSSS